jgi:NTP pyrophosphatase (non-canonical NTP hydrolase)
MQFLDYHLDNKDQICVFLKEENYIRMNKEIDLSKISESVTNFRDERDWKQFHTIKNLSIAMSIESSELMEIFQWASEEELRNIIIDKHEAISEEIADVFLYLLLIANEAAVDLETAVINKIAKNREKYPVEKSKSSSKKY